MAQFSDLGAICHLQDCKQRDFLPFQCDRCHHSFCVAHRTPDSHNCSVSTNERNVLICSKCHSTIRLSSNDDPATAMAFHQKRSCKPVADTPNCPVPGCDKKLTEGGSIVCPRCKRRVCLSHRYEDSHNCVGGVKPGSPGRAHGVVADWKCSGCKTVNLGTSYRCLKCNVARKPDSPIMSPKKQPVSPKRHHKCVIS